MQSINVRPKQKCLHWMCVMYVTVQIGNLKKNFNSKNVTKKIFHLFPFKWKKKVIDSEINNNKNSKFCNNFFSIHWKECWWNFSDYYFQCESIQICLNFFFNRTSRFLLSTKLKIDWFLVLFISSSFSDLVIVFFFFCLVVVVISTVFRQ